MKFSTAAYIRLSRKDGDKIESDSIVNQRTLINNFINDSPDLCFYKNYEDDDYTGTNFNRPAFKEMLKDIQDKRVNCVVVKDLSRFGRDYIDVGDYLQRKFPAWDIRFISINDNIDSYKKSYDMIMPFKNIFNEHYARDISSKVISAMRTKQRSGVFIGAFSSYGYLKDPERKGKLIIDQYAANIVRRIFDMYIDGVGQQSIAKQLNKERILCPSEYKKTCNENYHNSNKLDSTNYWTYSTVHNILKNEMYIGNMVQGKNNASRYRSKTTRKVEKKDWIVVPNTHEPIISKEIFEKVQNLLTHRTRDMGFENKVSLFAGFLKCADCGRGLSKIKSNERIRYVCRTYKSISSELCSSHRVFEDELSQIVLKCINEKISQVQNIVEYINKKEKEQKNTALNLKLANNVKQLNNQLAKITKLKKGLYEDYKGEIISKEEYLQYKEDYTKQEQNINLQIESINKIQNNELNVLKENPWIVNFKNKQQITELNRVILGEFIDTIIIYKNNKIKIKYRFSEEGLKNIF